MLTLIALVALAQGPVVDNLNGVPSSAPPAAYVPPKQGAHVCGTLEAVAPAGVKPGDLPGCKALLSVGTPAPFAGVLLDGQEDTFRTRRETRSETKVKDYEVGNFIMPIAAYLGITGGAVALAIGALLGLLAVTGHLR